MRARRLLEDKEDKKWEIKLKIADEWAEASKLDVDDDEEFDQFKTILLPKIRKFYKRMKTFMEAKPNALRALKKILIELNNTKDALEWDHYWEHFFLWADEHNVYIEVPRDKKKGAKDPKGLGIEREVDIDSMV